MLASTIPVIIWANGVTDAAENTGETSNLKLCPNL